MGKEEKVPKTTNFGVFRYDINVTCQITWNQTVHAALKVKNTGTTMSKAALKARAQVVVRISPRFVIILLP